MDKNPPYSYLSFLSGGESRPSPAIWNKFKWFHLHPRKGFLSPWPVDVYFVRVCHLSKGHKCCSGSQ